MKREFKVGDIVTWSKTRMYRWEVKRVHTDGTVALQRYDDGDYREAQNPSLLEFWDRSLNHPDTGRDPEAE